MAGALRLRRAVRVLLLDEEDRLLLLGVAVPRTRPALWIAPGGGLEDGEDARLTAAREIGEETGLADLQVGPEVWHRRHAFSWRGVEWDQRERWFMARTERFEPSSAGMSEEEREDLAGYRWWSLDELELTPDELAPRALAVLLRELLANGPPAHPIEIGE
jgi:8-oxo-dGTP pyrophosphatase MutT (NUDIX family)